MSDRIAFFTPTLQLGGAERKTAILANAMAARGLEVDVCTAEPGGVVRKDIGANVRMVDFGARRMRSCLLPLRRYLVENRPRVLFGIQCHTGLMSVMASLLSGTNTPVVIVEQSLTLSRLKEKSAYDYHKFRALVRLLYPRAARVVAISRDVRDDLVRHAGLDPAIIDLIHNPAAIPILAETETEADWTGWPQTDDPVIATVGRLVEVKDVPTLLRAFALLRSRRRAKLAIIGDGPDRKYLEAVARAQGIADDTCFLGARNRPWNYLRRADAFVMSSRFEGFGNTLVEAMAVGCPVVSTRCPGGPSDILEDGLYGPMVPVGDHVAMAAAIEKVLDFRPSPERLAMRARDFGEPVIDSYMHLIASVSRRDAPASQPQWQAT